MTATETPPEAHEQLEGHQGSGDPGESHDGLYNLIASNDHKDVGRMWIGASILFLVLLVALGVALAVDGLSVDPTVFGSTSRAFQAWVLFRTAAIFMVVIPMFLGIATLISPLQVGSASIAFPRLASASFWAWLFASIVHVISFLADGGLGPADTTSVQSTLLTMTSLGFMIFALLGASICVATTIIALRPSGMSLLEVPVFSWSMLVATSIWLVSLPVLVSSLILSYVDLQGRPFLDFGDPELLWARLEWAWAQPQVFAYAIPVFGILAEILPVMTKTRQVGRPALFGLISAFGALSFGAWAQSFYSKGADELVNSALIYDELLYILFGIVIFIPAFGAFSGAMDQIRRGSVPKPDGAVLGAVFGSLLLLAAIVAGEARVLAGLLNLVGLDVGWSALESDGILLSSSTAILILVVSAAMAACLGAIGFWAPKIFGGYASEGLAALGALALLGGGLAAGIGNMVAAFDGQADDIRFITSLDGLAATMSFVSLIGVGLIAIGTLAMILALVPAMRSTEALSDDPWGGHTLEWATPSPPPTGNFIEPVGIIRSPEPLLDEMEELK